MVRLLLWGIVVAEAANGDGAGDRSHGLGLAAFTLVRGGAHDSDFTMYVNSRRCLREALPAVIEFDDVAFHEGNVPVDVQLRLRQQV